MMNEIKAETKEVRSQTTREAKIGTKTKQKNVLVYQTSDIIRKIPYTASFVPLYLLLLTPVWQVPPTGVVIRWYTKMSLAKRKPYLTTKGT